MRQCELVGIARSSYYYQGKGEKPWTEKQEMKGHTIIFSLDRPNLYDVRVTGSWLDWDPDGISMEPDEKGRWSVAL